MLDACNGRAPYVLPFILCGTCSYPFQPLRHSQPAGARGPTGGVGRSRRASGLGERVGRMRCRTRGGSPARSVVAGGAGGQRLSRGWTRRVFCRTSFALSTPILSSPLLSAADLRCDCSGRARMTLHRQPRALSRSAAPPSTSTTTPIAV